MGAGGGMRSDKIAEVTVAVSPDLVFAEGGGVPKDWKQIDPDA